jgi:hypothetical protein
MKPSPEVNLDAYFVLSSWCTATKTWREAPARYCTPDDARATAVERGIYLLAYVREGKRCDLDAWAVVADD